MRIAYFSPLNPKKTGIADYSEELLPYLGQHADIDLFVDGYVPTNPDITRNFAVYDYLLFERMWWQRRYDIALYHIGNDPCHEYIYRTLQQYPGITVLHDFVIHHFIVSITVGRGNGEEYLREMEYSHGEQGAEAARNALVHGQNFPVWDYPLNRRVLDSSVAIIVHNQFCYDKVRMVNSNVPVAKIPLAMKVSEGDSRARSLLGIDAATFVVASFGLATPAKRIDVALRAFKEFVGYVGNAEFIIVGSVAEGYDIFSLIDELGLRDRVKVVGYVEKEMLQRFIEACDVCVNLRFPTSGETSGIALRAMAAGKPLIVSKVGSFAELPDDCCIKVGLDSQETEHLVMALRSLADDRQESYRVGRRAREYIQQHHDPALVAHEYVAIIENMLAGMRDGNTGGVSEDAVCDEGRAPVTSAVDVVEIVRSVRRSVRRSQQPGAVPDGIDEIGNLADPVALLRMLRYHILQAEEAYGSLFVEDQMRPTDALFGTLVDHLRRPLHSLVRFYLDLFAERQAAFNFVVANALAMFSQELSDLLRSGRQKEIGELRSNVEILSERAAGIERMLTALGEKGTKKASSERLNDCVR